MSSETSKLSSRVFALSLAALCAGALGSPGVLGAAGVDPTVEGQPAERHRAEIAALRAEIEALLARVAQLEAAQSAPAAVAPGPIAPASVAPAPAAAPMAWRWSGDLRYRSEFIDIESSPNRQRDRIRARVGLAADVSDGLSAVLRLATSDGLDPRGANATLGQLAERKTFGVELAYLRWQPGGPGSAWQLTAGKMPTPWRVTPGFFLDTDVNPEGLAVAWQRADHGPFASAFYLSLIERAEGRDSTLLGAQFGWRLSADAAVAVGFFDYQTLQGADPFRNRDANLAFGNTLTSGLSCRPGVTRCLVQDYDVLQALVDYRERRGRWPVRFFGEYARNLAFDRSLSSAQLPPGSRAGDSALALGVTLGELQAAGSFEWTLVYQQVERDALFAPWLDADFASGFSASSGTVMRLGYALSSRWRLNASWFDTERDLAAVPAGAAAAAASERREQRLQLDVNARF